MAEHDGAEHDFFAEFLGFGFNHQNSVGSACNDEIERRFRHFVDMRVEHVVAVDVTDAGACDRAHERDARDGQRSRSRDQSQDVGIVFQIVLQNGDDDLRVVLVAIRKQRAQRAVDQTRGQRLVLARAAFALEIAAGDLAGCVGLFLVVDGQRKEVLAGLRRLGRNDGGEHGGFAVGGDDGAVGLTGNLAGFQGERTAAPFNLDLVGIEHVLSFVCG